MKKINSDINKKKILTKMLKKWRVFDRIKDITLFTFGLWQFLGKKDRIESEIVATQNYVRKDKVHLIKCSINTGFLSG